MVEQPESPSSGIVIGGAVAQPRSVVGPRTPLHETPVSPAHTGSRAPDAGRLNTTRSSGVVDMSRNVPVELLWVTSRTKIAG